MAALIYLIETLLSLCLLAVLLRLLLQWSRADFRNPLARSIVHLTNPMIVPLRRLLPAIGRIDTASCVAVVVFALLKVSVSWLLSGFGPPPALIWLRLAAIEILRTTLWTYFFAIFIYALLSLVAPGHLFAGAEIAGVAVRAGAAPDQARDSAARRPRSLAAVGRHRDSGAVDSAALKRAFASRSDALRAIDARGPIKKGICAALVTEKSICVGAAVCYVARRFVMLFIRYASRIRRRTHSRRFGNGKKRWGTDQVGNSGPGFQGLGTIPQAGQ